MIGKKNKRNAESEDEGIDSDAWMITFSDLLTLMMTFFVMLLTMSSVDELEVTGLFGIFNSPFAGEAGLRYRSTKEGFGILNTEGGSGSIGTSLGGFLNMPFRYVPLSKARADAEDVERLLFQLARDAKRKITRFTEEETVELGNISVKFRSIGIIVYLPNRLLFKPGKADINPHSLTVFKLLGSWVRGKPYNIKIEGHTDDTKFNEMEYPSNWELSVNRAVNVMRFLRDNKYISAKRSGAYGYSKFQPLVPNDSEENRRKNNRMEIIFIRPKK